MTISNNTHTKNTIHNLPLEIWINSLEFLPLENILTFQKSCTTFKKIVPIALWSQAKTTPEFPLEVIKKTGFNSEKTYKPVIAKEMNMMFAVCNLDFSFKKNFMICATANNCLTILSQKFELLRNLDHRLDIDFSNAKISPDGTKIACSKFNTQIVRNADSCTSVAILIEG